MPLNDKEIRPNLVSYLKQMYYKPLKVVEELPVCFGNAIADVVSINSRNLHCYEIKGETDSISRVTHQAVFYNQSFRKITLVTTNNHVRYAYNIIPEYWGIILVKTDKNGDISFKYLRKAQNNPYFSKEKALQTLWRDELLTIAQKENIHIPTKTNKTTITHIVSSILSYDYVNKYITSLVSQRA